MSGSKVIIVRKKKQDMFLKLKQRFNRPVFGMKQEVLEEFMHADELEASEHITEGILDKRQLTFFYPGCGLDVVQPLLYALKICSAERINFVFADKDLKADELASLMLQLTDNHNYTTKKVDRYTEVAEFFFQDRYISFICKSGDVLTRIPKELKAGYDVYFERAFEIFREENPSFLPDILDHLNKDGIVISDAGLPKEIAKDLEKIKVSPKAKPLGFYKRLSMYRKK